MVKSILRKLVPKGALELNRRRKKKKRRSQLKSNEKEGRILTVDALILDFTKAGIVAGDSVLVHSAMSKIGFLKHGPQTFIDALIKVVGADGNILMPTSPNAGWQIDYARENPVFDVANTPSKTGAITEYFRKMKGAVRSIHPTEPVSVLGPKAHWFVDEHFGQLTPYNKFSPFHKLSECGGKILYIGVTLDNAGTNLHTLEDAVDFKFPVYHPEIFTFDVIDYNGKKHKVRTKIHNPEFSKKRKCDALLPMFEKNGVVKRCSIGEASTLVVAAKKLLDVMLEEYQQQGVTMYTPKGSN